MKSQKLKSLLFLTAFVFVALIYNKVESKQKFNDFNRAEMVDMNSEENHQDKKLEQITVE